MNDPATDLLARFRDEAPTAFVAPDLDELKVRGTARLRRRLVRGGGLGVAVAAVIVLAISTLTPVPTPPVPPPPVADIITDVDWTNTELTVPENPGVNCPHGTLRIEPKNYQRFGDVGQAGEERSYLQLLATPPAYGDLTGDGQPEAVLAIRCTDYPPGSMDQEGAQLLVVTMRPDHSLVGLQFVGKRNVQYPSFHVDAGVLYVQMRYNYAFENSFGGTANDVAFTQQLRWNGVEFVRIAGRTDPLNFTGRHDGYFVPTELEAIRVGDAVVCPAALVGFGQDAPSSGAFTFGHGRPPQPFDVDGDGDEELVVAVRCSGPVYSGTSLYVLSQGVDRFRTRDIPFTDDGRYQLESFQVNESGLTVTVIERATGTTEVRRLVWDGTRFRPA